ncbi:MAG: ABC transporter permease [Dehalococcoidia bacterium]|nr:ABC transporter permease [Dehalococcoidia bacterium]
MSAYIVRRLLWMPVILLAVSFITLLLGLYGPGDPAQVLLGQHTNPEVVARIRAQWGLDDPFMVQFGKYLWNVLHLDFGESLRFRGQDIGGLILPKIWISMQLAFVAMGLSLLVGIPVGILAAFKRATWIDTAAVGFTLLGVSTPTFVLAPILQWFFVRQLHLLPTAGWEGIWSVKIIMPAIVLGMGPIAAIARQTRVSIIEVMGQEYVRVAHAKGLTQRIITLRHILKNAMIPVFTLIGFMIADLPAGSLITEMIFGVPGIGPFAFDAIFNRDYPVIMATTLVVAFSYVVVNLLVDIGYTFLDPRIRYA